MFFSRNLSVILVIAVVGCAQFDSDRLFEATRADDIRIGTTAKQEARESPGQLHTLGLEPMAGKAPDTRTKPMAPMQGVPGPMGGEKDTEYRTYQYTKHDAATVAQHMKG
jgi:hypothetical protein